MGAVTARAAGVGEVAVCAPPGDDGELHPAILAACALCDVDAVYRMGGAQAIAALAFGTDAVPAADVVVGPGNLYVQEAKRQLSHRVGIDGFAGPSELLVVLAGEGARPARAAALDLLAQAEHGVESLVAAVAPDAAVLRALGDDLGALAPSRPTVAATAAVLVHAADVETALAFAQALAPEHVQLVGAEAEMLAPLVTRAGCVFVGRASATAFGDYVAGSNHVLPTGGAARFASPLGPGTFRRRTSEVRVDGAASELAGAGAALARAEGFVVHAQSMEARVQENEAP
jgi:histidinol dehydrogenase